MHAYDLYNCHLKFHMYMYMQDIKIQHAFEFWASVFIIHLIKKLERKVTLQSKMKRWKF